MKNIATAFVKAQRDFAPALKTSTNPHFKSKYADLATCVEAVIDALNTNGIAMIQRTHDDETGVTVETVFIHESGETIESGRLHVPAAKNDPQGYGSALTYARRYSLMAACGIAPEDDDGNSASRKPKNQTLTDSAVADFVATISGSETMDVLKNAFAEAYRAAEIALDDKAKASFEKAKNERKQYFIDKEKKA
ncbi:MAG TPA: ERF family protein [Rugosibacter sp.]|nr:ERF family protein [Rugosibacter sp.]